MDEDTKGILIMGTLLLMSIISISMLVDYNLSVFECAFVGISLICAVVVINPIKFPCTEIGRRLGIILDKI